MQVLDETKRRRILEAAQELFAIMPFHEVKLADVARRAGLGKGTLYCYFESKDHLYETMLVDSFHGMNRALREAVQHRDEVSPREALRLTIRSMVDTAFSRPRLMDLMRSHQFSLEGSAAWNQARKELAAIFQDIVERGVATGDFEDPNPPLTAVMIPGMVRSALLFASGGSAEEVSGHLFDLLDRAIVKEKAMSCK